MAWSGLVAKWGRRVIGGGGGQEARGKGSRFVCLSVFLCVFVH